jgi:hypothetical protein
VNDQTAKALAFAEYMATAAEHYLTAVNAEDMARNSWETCTEPGHKPLEWDKYHAAEFERCEFANSLRSRIYEFRKRAAATRPDPALVTRLKSLRVVLGIDSPETRGWAPVVQQEARRVIDDTIAALAAGSAL